MYESRVIRSGQSLKPLVQLFTDFFGGMSNAAADINIHNPVQIRRKFNLALAEYLYLRSQAIAGIADAKVIAIGVAEDEGADAGFRVHHHAFGEFDADIFGVK